MPKTLFRLSTQPLSRTSAARLHFRRPWLSWCRTGSALVAALTSLTVGPGVARVRADDAPAPQDTAPAAAPPTVLSDVVVTAKKREEKLQDVPLPVTAVSGNDVTKRSINTSNDVERIAPNLSAQSSNGRSSRPRWFLRGIGSNDPSVNLESPLGVYQDEVYIAYVPAQSFPLFDLERVEVLKGPQGTLWGKNTTGGAIHFVSRKPTFDPSGYAKAGVGNYGLQTAEGGFGGGLLGDRIAGRASFYYESFDGWAPNQATGKKEPAYNDFATRLQLLANLTDDVDLLVSGRFRNLNGGNNPQYFVPDPNAVGVPPGTIQQYPGGPTYTPPYGSNPQIGDPFFRGAGTNALQTSGITGTLNWHFGDTTLTVISAFDRVKLNALTQGFAPIPTFDISASPYSDVNSRQVFQEVRLASPRAAAFSFIVGANYFNWHLWSEEARGTFGPQVARRSYIDNRLKQDDISGAGFASATYRPIERFAVTGGFRYTVERKTVRAQRLSGNGANIAYTDPVDWWRPEALQQFNVPLAVLNIDGKETWSRPTWDLTPEYRLAPQALLFVRYARGFRSGGFNPTIIPAANGNPAYLPKADPEVLDDYELGLKTSWFKGRLNANAAAFYYHLQDAQLNVQQPNPGGIPNANTSTLQNAAGGNIRGLELEVDALPLRNLRLSGGLGLLRSKYTDFNTFQGATPIDASGNRFYRTPNTSFVVAAEYTQPLGGRAGSLAGSTDWSFRSRIYHNAVVQNDPIQQTPAYTLGNAEIRYVTADGRLTLQLYVKNLTDKSYKVLSQVVNLGAYPTSLGAPRTFGANVIARF